MTRPVPLAPHVTRPAVRAVHLPAGTVTDAPHWPAHVLVTAAYRLRYTDPAVLEADAAVLLAAARVLRAGNTCPQPIDLGAAT